ncbi:MAG: hypothetical protein WC607_00585 [Candidatus Micrarchaeia archaeon]
MISSVFRFIEGVFVAILSVLHTILENFLGAKGFSTLNEEYLWAIAGLLFFFYWTV